MQGNRPAFYPYHPSPPSREDEISVRGCQPPPRSRARALALPRLQPEAKPFGPVPFCVIELQIPVPRPIIPRTDEE